MIPDIPWYITAVILGANVAIPAARLGGLGRFNRCTDGSADAGAHDRTGWLRCWRHE